MIESLEKEAVLSVPVSLLTSIETSLSWMLKDIEWRNTVLAPTEVITGEDDNPSKEIVEARAALASIRQLLMPKPKYSLDFNSASVVSDVVHVGVLVEQQKPYDPNDPKYRLDAGVTTVQDKMVRDNAFRHRK